MVTQAKQHETTEEATPLMRTWLVTYRVRHRTSGQPHFLLTELISAPTERQAQREFHRRIKERRPELRVDGHIHTLGNYKRLALYRNRPDGPNGPEAA